MAQKIGFRLAHKGRTYKYITTNHDDKLLLVVRNRAAMVIKKKEFELFWNDDESDIILATTDDLSAAIDYAMCTRKSPDDTPLVRLSFAAAEWEAVAARRAKKAAARKGVDPLAPIKEQLLNMFESALEQDWTADLRSAMNPLFCPQTKQVHKPSKLCAAEIAVQLATLEMKMSDELTTEMKKLKVRKGLRKWLEQTAKERAAADKDSTDAVLAAVAAVKLVVNMSEAPFNAPHEEDADAGFQSHFVKEVEEDEDEPPRCNICNNHKGVPLRAIVYGHCSDDEDEDDEECKEDTNDDWLTKQTKAIVKITDEHGRKAYFVNPVYPCPKEYLEKMKKTSTKSVATEPTRADRAERIQMYLEQQLLDSSLDAQQLRKIARELSIHCSKLNCCQDDDEFAHWDDSEEAIRPRVAVILARTTVNLPDSLLKQLQLLPADKLASVVVRDWMDTRLAEEKRSEEKPTDCSAMELHDLLYVCGTALVYPEKLQQMVKRVIKRHYDKLEEENTKSINRCLNAHKRKERLEHHTKVELNRMLSKYTAHAKVGAFMNAMLPKETYAEPDPALEYPEWVALFESLDITEEMKEYIGQLQSGQPSPLTTELAIQLYRLARDCTKQNLEDLDLESADLEFDLFTPLKRRMEKRYNDAKKSKQQVDNGFSAASLAVINFFKTMDPSAMIEYFEKRGVRKSTTANDSEDAASTYSTDWMADDERPTELELTAWVEQQSAGIIKRGLAKLAPVLEYTKSKELEQSTTEQSAPIESVKSPPKASTCRKLKPEDNEDPVEKKKELKIREKALQLKEEAFERKVATFEVKMEEFEDKLAKLDKRIEELEDSTLTEYVEAKINEIEERLEKIEGKEDEDDDNEIVLENLSHFLVCANGHYSDK